eukprot:4766444-Pyramimonas_sp.AAC.1
MIVASSVRSFIAAAPDQPSGAPAVSAPDQPSGGASCMSALERLLLHFTEPPVPIRQGWYTPLYNIVQDQIQPARRQGRAQFGRPLGGRCDTVTHSNGASHKK